MLKLSVPVLCSLCWRRNLVFSHCLFMCFLFVWWNLRSHSVAMGWSRSHDSVSHWSWDTVRGGEMDSIHAAGFDWMFLLPRPCTGRKYIHHHAGRRIQSREAKSEPPARHQPTQTPWEKEKWVQSWVWKNPPVLQIMRNQWPLVYKTNVFSLSVLYPVMTLNLFLLIQNKAELAQKARKEIADYLSSGKDERARIRVEHIIREDYLVEAMEILELYCDLLLARFGLIQSMKWVLKDWTYYHSSWGLLHLLINPLSAI